MNVETLRLLRVRCLATIDDHRDQGDGQCLACEVEGHPRPAPCIEERHARRMRMLLGRVPPDGVSSGIGACGAD